MRNLPAEFTWTPLESFEWWRPGPETDGPVDHLGVVCGLDERDKVPVGYRLIGQYLPGMKYNCTKKPIHDILRVQCSRWVEEGKISVDRLPAGQTFSVAKFNVGK